MSAVTGRRSVAAIAPWLLVIALAGGCAPAPTADPGPGEVLDGFVLGAPRELSGPEFHRLEVTARDVAASAWPTRRANSFYVHSAGTLPSGEIQHEAEGPFTFLVEVGLVGGERHAMVIQCDEATFPDSGSCRPADGGS